MHKSLLKFFLFTFCFIIVSAFTSIYYIAQELAYRAPADKIIFIDKGQSTNAIAITLKNAKCIKDILAFKMIARYYYMSGKFIQSGEYAIIQGENILDILHKIIQGDRIVRKITFPEGVNKFQIANILSGAEGLIYDIDTNKFEEGMLYPDTYYYYKNDKGSKILETMHSKMVEFINKTFISNNNYLSNNKDIITLASIVEKETSISAERPIVASVYLNRLKIGMPLQADPTVIYGLFAGNTDYNYRLSRADLKSINPYNTYQFSGLPPSAIASPSASSVFAVLQPAETNFLYFVADGNGGHKFAKNIKDHNNNVASLRKLQRNN